MSLLSDLVLRKLWQSSGSKKKRAPSFAHRVFAVGTVYSQPLFRCGDRVGRRRGGTKSGWREDQVARVRGKSFHTLQCRRNMIADCFVITRLKGGPDGFGRVAADAG